MSCVFKFVLDVLNIWIVAILQNYMELLPGTGVTYFILCRTYRTYTPWWLSGKEYTCQCRRCGFDPRVEKIPWRRAWQTNLIFLSGKFHGQKSLAGYSPWCRKRVRHDWATDRQERHRTYRQAIIPSLCSIIWSTWLKLQWSEEILHCEHSFFSWSWES